MRCIINNVPVSCLVDSGAGITCISSNTLAAINKANKCTMENLPNPYISVTSAAGSHISTKSKKSLEFTTPDGNTVSFPTFVIDNLHSDCILGTDFLKATNAKADFSNNVISFNGGHLFSLTYAVPQIDEASLDLDLFPVLAATHSVVIPPCSSKRVLTKVLTPPNSKVSFQPGDNVECHGDPECILNGIIAIGKDNSASVMCINTTTEPRHITKGDDLAHISLLPDLDALLPLCPATKDSPVTVTSTNSNAATIAAMPCVQVTNAS